MNGLEERLGKHKERRQPTKSSCPAKTIQKWHSESAGTLTLFRNWLFANFSTGGVCVIQENLFSFAEAAQHLLYAGDLQPQKSADKRAI